MKTTLSILLATLLCPVCSLAQNQILPFRLEKLELKKNVIGTPGLTLVLNIALDNVTLNTSYYINPANRPDFHIAYGGKIPDCPLTARFAVTDSSVRIVLNNLTQETLDRIDAKDNKISVVFDSDIRFEYTDNSAPGIAKKTGMITKEEANKKLDKELSFPADEKTKFLTALNNMYYYKNSVDFGVQPGQDSASVAYTLSLSFQNVYNKPSLLTCGAGTQKSNRTLVYYGVSGRLSNNFKDSLNFINAYPLIIQHHNYEAKLPNEWNVKVGHESNQSFTNRRIAADASLSAIIPNLIDLTSSSSARLRLKPVLTLGLKGYYDYSKNVDAFTSGQAYIGIYYYLPVYDHYAIILNDKTFYDFSSERNPEKQVLSNYSVAVGTEIPGTSFKVMFKYENGRSDINYKQSEAVVIGLIMNLFNDNSAK